ncbi:MAG: ribosome biogenesis GTPase Der [Deltaproteobacteria bacterium]|nr:ribosome biogenesis GTPase Der [Deltaproteobacteria bacterium]
MKPIVSIVGRPNVGKSTLLNRLAGRQVAVVEDEPGVTRDRLFVETRLGRHDVVLVDTGGFDLHPSDELARAAVELAREAVADSDLIVFLCDGRDGLMPLDREVADVLRRSGKPFVCAVNKCDPGAGFRQALEFFELGLEPLLISAAHGVGLDQLAEQASALLPEPLDAGPEKAVDATICLLGRPNVGKSSLANALAGSHRQLVSEIPGTTRDAVDIRFERDGKSCLLVDTPGLRRRRSIAKKLEKLSVLAAIRSLERAELSVVILDASETLSDQDARLLRLVHDRGRGLVVAVNKVDLWESEKTRHAFLDELSHGMRFVSYAPVLCMSARTGVGVDSLVPTVLRVKRNTGLHVPTGELNRFAIQAQERMQPPVVRGRRARIYYITQAGQQPPTFIAWVSDPSRLPEHYRRYLENRLREQHPFEGVPLRWIFRKREQKRSTSRSASRRRKRGGR